MFNWINQQRKTKEQKNSKSLRKDPGLIEKGLDEDRLLDFINDSEVKADKKAENEIEPGATVKENIGISTQSQEELVVVEPVEASLEYLTEHRLQEQDPSNEEAKSGSPEKVNQNLYSGEVDIAMHAPVDLKIVAKLYTTFQNIRGLRILYSSGSINRGVFITISIDNPIPLISIISSELPGIKAKVESSKDSSFVQEKQAEHPNKKRVKRRGILLIPNK